MVQYYHISRYHRVTGITTVTTTNQLFHVLLMKHVQATSLIVQNILYFFQLVILIVELRVNPLDDLPNFM